MRGKKILCYLLLISTFLAKSQDGLKISGTAAEFYKSLYEDTYDTSSFNFELLLRADQYWWQFSNGDKVVIKQNFDINKIGHIRFPVLTGLRTLEKTKNERVVPTPLKMNNAKLLYELYNAETDYSLQLGNKLTSNVLDSVNWAFKAWDVGMSYEMSAHMGSKKQHQILEYDLLSITYENLDSIISLRDKRWEKELPDELIERFEKATELRAENGRVPENFDSLHKRVQGSYHLKNATIIYWYKGCMACSKLILDLNRSLIPDTSVVLFNPVDSDEVASEYLSRNSIRFKNYCIAKTSEISAYPTTLFECSREEIRLVCHEVGYSKETFETILSAIETKHVR